MFKFKFKRTFEHLFVLSWMKKNNNFQKKDEEK